MLTVHNSFYELNAKLNAGDHNKSLKRIIEVILQYEEQIESQRYMEYLEHCIEYMHSMYSTKGL